MHIPCLRGLCMASLLSRRFSWEWSQICRKHHGMVKQPILLLHAVISSPLTIAPQLPPDIISQNVYLHIIGLHWGDVFPNYPNVIHSSYCLSVLLAEIVGWFNGKLWAFCSLLIEKDVFFLSGALHLSLNWTRQEVRKAPHAYDYLWYHAHVVCHYFCLLHP